MNRHCESVRDAACSFEKTVSLDNVVANNNAVTGWPSYSDPYGMSERNLALQRAVFGHEPHEFPAQQHFYQYPATWSVVARPCGIWGSHCACKRISHARRDGRPGNALGGFFVRIVGTS